MAVHGRDCLNHKIYHLARLSVLVKINLELFPLALKPICKVRYLHCHLTKKVITCTHFLQFFLSFCYSKCTWLMEIILESMCNQVHGFSFCPGYYSCIFMILKSIAFSIGDRCDIKLCKSTDWHCTLFRLLWFNTFTCVHVLRVLYFHSWEHKAMFIVCFICYMLQK